MYTHNDSSQYLPSYPPRPESSFEDFKHPYDEDIIDSYASSEVPLPINPQQTYPTNPSYPVYDNRQPTYPAHAKKQSFFSGRTGMSEADTATFDGGGGTNLAPPLSKESQENRSFWQTVLPDSMACRLYVLTVILETIVDIAVESDLLLRVRHVTGDGDLGTQRLPVYLSIFVFAHLCQLVMAIEAVHTRNTLQFLFLTGFNALLLAYAVIQIFEIRQSLTPKTSGGITDIPVNVLTTIIPIVISVAEIAYVALGWKIWTEFGWKVYKRLGANRQVKRMYAHYQIFVCLIKFDVFFFIGFTAQLIWIVLNRKDWQWYVTCAALPFSFLLLVVGMFAARHENKPMMITFMLGCAGAMVYFVYKIIKVFSTENEFADVVKSLAIFAFIAIALLIVTFVMAIIVMRNFGGGLKYHLSKSKHRPMASLHRRGTEHQVRHQSYPLGYNPNRMSID